jgi:hypothetical protein
MLISLLAFVLAVGGYSLAARRPGHTRLQLVLSAAVGGGVAGALFGIVGTSRGGTFADLLPFELVALIEGLLVGVLGVLAVMVGKWLGREP